MRRIAHGFRGLLEGVSCAANDCIAEHLQPEDLERIERDVAERFEELLDALLIERDHNTQDTARRVAKMYVREVFHGRYQPAPDVTEFPNAKGAREAYSVGPVTVRSTCSHHFCPIEGQVWIGVSPGERLIGLSKFSRLAQWVLARPQIQEEATVQLADLLVERIEPKGLIVAMRSRHHCMTWRGVMEHETTMTTIETRGSFKKRSSRHEIMALLKGQGF